ncbi:response regulator transcription factor [Microbulbifer sp. ZKSA002]|uniref:response regulator transcription factor n=1 Tax=Microbulbifer sp. ZKSA002 TaxID=3243388 RepID=UPI004039F12A
MTRSMGPDYKTPILVLLAEDNHALASNIIESLEEYNIRCDFADNGIMATELALKHDFDVIVLDVMMPGRSGFEVSSKLRNAGSSTPILMLTALDQLDDKITGFQSGGDDYLVKPFEMLELVARIRSLSIKRRVTQTRYKVEDLEVNLETHEVTRQGKSINLPPICWELLVFLMQQSPKLVTKEKIEQHLWQFLSPESDVIKVHLYRLRQGIDKGFSFPLLHTIRGKGVILGKRDESL